MQVVPISGPLGINVFSLARPPHNVPPSCSLGVAHPPGYPLHTILGALFLRLIPVGTPAFRVNLVSVIAASGATLLLPKLPPLILLPPPRRAVVAECLF
jgi:hypothetical protein